jgi:hypothetical protein
MPDVEKDAGVLAECGWVGPWQQAFNACVRWSQMHGHRHRLRWSAERQHWRIACVTPPGGSDA